jgi:hypothetical protein
MTIAASGLTQTDLSGGDNDDTINVRRTVATVTTRVFGNAGDDLIRLSSNAGLNDDGRLSSILGPMSVDAGGGDNNRLIVSDYADSGNADVTVTDSQITGLAPVVIPYTATGGHFRHGAANDGILIRGSLNDPDQITVLSTRGGSTTYIESHGGSDLLNVGSKAATDNGQLDPVAGLLSLDPGTHADVVHINDHGSGFPVPLPLNAGNTTAKFNYYLDAQTVRNDPSQPPGLARPFAGVNYVGTATERLELIGTDNVNVFTVLPSLDTEYFVHGKLPPSGVCQAGGGDYLRLGHDRHHRTQAAHPRAGQGLLEFHQPAQAGQLREHRAVQPCGHCGAVGAVRLAAARARLRCRDGRSQVPGDGLREHVPRRRAGGHRRPEL